MKKLNKIRVIEQPKSDRPLTFEEMLNIEGGLTCGEYTTVDACSDYMPTCGMFDEEGLCDATSTAGDTFCEKHKNIGIDF